MNSLAYRSGVRNGKGTGDPFLPPAEMIQKQRKENLYMGKERITRRQKDVSRLIREKKKMGSSMGVVLQPFFQAMEPQSVLSIQTRARKRPQIVFPSRMIPFSTISRVFRKGKG